MAIDLSGQDLRGRTFADARMAGASLAGADLRGVDFTGADLRGADLSHARTGMSHGWTALVDGGALVVSVAMGVLSGQAGRFLQHVIASADPRRRIMGIFAAIVLGLFLVVGVWKGLLAATRTVLPVAAAVAVMAAVIGAASGFGSGAGAMAALAFVFAAVAIVMMSVVARAVAGTTGHLFFAVVAISGALTGRALGGGLAALAVALSAMIMARQAPTRKESFPALTRLTTAIACRGGTHFLGADLTGANLAGAQLVACDLRETRLRGANFEGAEIRLCRFDQAAGAPPVSSTGKRVVPSHG